MRENWLRNKKEAERLVQAGVGDTVINAAMSAFVLETMAHHGEPAEVRAARCLSDRRSGVELQAWGPDLEGGYQQW